MATRPGRTMPCRQATPTPPGPIARRPCPGARRWAADMGRRWSENAPRLATASDPCRIGRRCTHRRARDAVAPRAAAPPTVPSWPLRKGTPRCPRPPPRSPSARSR
jgi:hypothetical protein